MKNPKSPCLGCSKRDSNCHCACDTYKSYTVELEAYKEFMRDRNPQWLENGYSDYRYKRMKGFKR